MFSLVVKNRGYPLPASDRGDESGVSPLLDSITILESAIRIELLFGISVIGLGHFKLLLIHSSHRVLLRTILALHLDNVET
jgi:hypothetical protein